MRLFKVALAASLSVLLMATGPALAAPKDDGTKAHENSGQHNGNSGTRGNGKGNEGNGLGNGGTTPGSKPPPVDGKAALPPTNFDAEQIRTQVESHHAMSLDEVLKVVGRLSRGRMLDIRPISIGQFLVYDVTVLERGGVVRHLMLDARTGQQVRVVR